jgi:hypothetical protein
MRPVGECSPLSAGVGLRIDSLAERVRPIVFHDPFSEIASSLRRAAIQLRQDGAGATATVRQVFQFANDPTLFVVVPPDQLDRDALRQAANGSDDVVKRAAIDFPGRPVIALASTASFMSSAIDGVTVLKQWSVRMTGGQHEIVVVLRRDGDTVVVDSVK